MTLEELNKKRDELAKHEDSDGYFGFKSGWDDAVDTLIPKLHELECLYNILAEKNEKLIEGLKHYSNVHDEYCGLTSENHRCDCFVPNLAIKTLKEMGIE